MAPEVHIYSNSSLGQPRGNLEDDIDDRFCEEAEVCGGGQFLDRPGWNIDIELLDEDADIGKFAKKLITFLKKWGVPKDTHLRLFESDWEEGQKPQRVDVFGESGGAMTKRCDGPARRNGPRSSKRGRRRAGH